MSVDTIVLKIEEIEGESPVLGRIDTTLYIFYDHSISMYCIRGSRRGKYNPYSFTCISAKDVSLFVEHVIGNRNSVSYTLLTYRDLPYESDNIDFYYLQNNEDNDIERNEIVGFDSVKLKYGDRFLKTYLRLIRVVFNDFVQV